MSITILDADPSLRSEGCPGRVIKEANRSSRQVAKIVWDDDLTPEHCKGYVEWSVRPYLVTDRCDGTRDSNAMLVFIEFCKSTGLDPGDFYAEASPEDANHLKSDDYLSYLDERRDMTVTPPVTDANMIQLLNSLYSMNWRSLVEVLVDRWSSQGFNVDSYDEFD